MLTNCVLLFMRTKKPRSFAIKPYSGLENKKQCKKHKPISVDFFSALFNVNFKKMEEKHNYFEWIAFRFPNDRERKVILMLRISWRGSLNFVCFTYSAVAPSSALDFGSAPSSALDVIAWFWSSATVESGLGSSVNSAPSAGSSFFTWVSSWTLYFFQLM